MNKTQLSWTVGIVASLLAIGGGAKTFWFDFGWVTPATAQAAHEEIEKEHLAGGEALKEFRDEWKCDEYEEELQYKKRRIKKVDPSSDEYSELEYEIERIQNKMDKLRCSRFEDFG